MHGDKVVVPELVVAALHFCCKKYLARIHAPLASRMAFCPSADPSTRRIRHHSDSNTSSLVASDISFADSDLMATACVAVLAMPELSVRE
jgi:hypothetical protein